MCVAVPAKLIEKKENTGIVEIGGAKVSISLRMLPSAKIGDYLIIHAGFALDKIDEKEAEIRLKLFEDLSGGYFSA